PPRERGDAAGDGEAKTGADVLAGEDDAVDPAAFPTAEPVTDQGSDDRTCRRGDGAEEEPRPEELREARRRRAPEHRDAPEANREAEDGGSCHPVGQDAERQSGERTHERAHGDEQADVRVVDMEPRAQLRRRRAYGRGVGAAQPEYGGEDQDDPRPLLAAE